MGPGPALGRDLAEVCGGGGEADKGGDGVGRGSPRRCAMAGSTQPSDLRRLGFLTKFFEIKL